MTKHYLDNSATTPLCPAAMEKMQDVMANTYGNPSSLHTLGLEAEKILTEARMAILSALCPARSGIRPKAENLIFTGSGTEANNLALIGCATAKARNKGKHIIVGETEHASIIESAKHLEALGFRVTYIPAPDGVWDMTAYKAALSPDTILVSAMLVNNETGSVSDIAAIAKEARAKNPDVIIHTDAVQGFLKVMTSPLPHADMVTVSAHKIGGPKGVGALFVNDRILKTKSLVPVIHGGGQEKNLRSGTENTIGIAGFGAAAAYGLASFRTHYESFTKLRARFAQAIADFPENTVRINTPLTREGAPHIISLTAFGLRSETLLHSLSMSGVYVSSGSACSSNGGHGGYVLRSFGLSQNDADSTIRISLGDTTTEADIDALVIALRESTSRLAHKTGRTRLQVSPIASSSLSEESQTARSDPEKFSDDKKR